MPEAAVFVGISRRVGESDNMAECPECGFGIAADGLEEGEIVTCKDCGTELEVRGLNPLLLERAPQEQEDWGE